MTTSSKVQGFLVDLALTDNVAVIVGAGGGIGKAIAESFAAAGAHLALLDVEPKVNLLADALETEYGVKALAVVCDVADYPAMERAAYQVLSRWERCDHVVYSAAVGSGRYGFPFWKLHPDDWPRVLQVNLLGAVNTAHAFAKVMAEAKRGTMLFISSVAGQIGSQTDPPYSASKAALINFAQCAAKDLAHFGVRVNTICPGMIRSALNRSVWEAWASQQNEEDRIPYEEWAEAKIKRLVPLGRWQEPQDVASMAVFLASERGKNITGQTINVDGGFVMHW
jgi:NAD(P)-dependent dehydrogenase (short-subunit alcohol dehydrogenase family)